MYFILIVIIVYLYLKYRDISKSLENVNNCLDKILGDLYENEDF